ncbi:cyclin-J18-like [Selaginella moellendorffii]|uniref:cyclin-J18-like n=1 Tax=Selaginella moellendorffii TaxID=88036 RepID=UPI000D1C3EB8|nr:cyclin-J18-like [Selaginella moellendorffii]|eukprot:XP_024539648.1 cyclin-J18-like [Selaginella moellendorffii]
MKFDVRTGTLVSDVASDLLSKLRNTATVGKLVKQSTVFHIIDLLYGDGQFNFASVPSDLSAASILAVAFAISIPDEQCNFPFLPWLTALSRASKREIERMARQIFALIFHQ